MPHSVIRAAAVVGCVVASAISAQQPRLSYVGDGPNHQMGRSLAAGRDINNDGKGDFISGARGTSTSTTFAGRAYLFSGTGAFIRTLSGVAPGDEFGCSVALIDDVNGDGTADILVGARGFDGPAGANSGRAYIFRGESSVPSCDYQLIATFDGAAPGAQFGQAVADMGDLNGDGVGDFAVGASHAASGGIGSVTVYSGASLLPLAVLSGGQVGDWFGYQVVPAGDVDGDGFGDVAVSAPSHDFPGAANTGRVYVYSGLNAADPGGFTLLRTYDGEQAFQSYGISLSGDSDIDGDGVPDLLVGSNQFDGLAQPTFDNRGKAYLYSGANGALLWSRVGDEYKDWFGIAVVMAGDLDGDGTNEFIIGACETEKGGRGKVYAFRRDGTQLFTLFGEVGSALPNQGDAFGFAAANAGDLDGDGANEFLVGAYGFDGFGGVNVGKTYLYSSAVRMSGVGFSAPHVMSLGASPWPKLGNTVYVTTSGAPPLSFGLLGISAGTNPQPFFGGVLFLDLTSYFLIETVADAAGESTVAFLLPTDVSFLNFTAHLQAAHIDLGQSQFVAHSNLLTLVTYL